MAKSIAHTIEKGSHAVIKTLGGIIIKNFFCSYFVDRQT